MIANHSKAKTVKGMIQALVFTGISLQVASAAAERPNIIFLLTDDQRHNSAGFMGNTEIKTPNLDRLAAEGMVFENHHNTTSICMPSRASIMSGKCEFVTGVSFERGNMTPESWAMTYPMLLRKAGYRTGFAGKLGFDVDFDSRKKGDGYSVLPVNDFDWWGGWPKQGRYTTKANKYLAKYSKEYPHVTRALGAAAQDFIADSAKQDKPFCLSISFKAPHGPLKADPIWDDLYKGVKFNPPPHYGGPETATHLAPQSALGRQRKSQLASYYPEENYQKNLSTYYRQIFGVDYAVGMIREALEKHGVADNTIIIFTADNGYFLGSHGFGGKVLLYEDATHVPMIICDPRNSASHGKRASGISSGVDIAPTILSYAGVPVPEDMNGLKLQPIMSDSEARIRDQLMLVQIWNNTRDDSIGSLGLVTEKYRYTYWFYGTDNMLPTEELFDRENDRYETSNLVGNPKYSKVLNEMQALYDKNLEQWKKSRTEKHEYPRYDIIADRKVPYQEKIYKEPSSARKTK